VGCDGLFLEVHEDPTGPLDGPNMLPMKDLPEVLKPLKEIHHLLREV